MASSNDKVLSWIGGASTIQGQSTVKLSKVIENFDADFANGYLIGEILYQYGIIESINTFSRK